MRFRNENRRLSSSFLRSESICFGIRHVQGTILEIVMTTSGVNSPQIKKTSAKTGTRLMSCQFLFRSWKSERVNALDATASFIEDLYFEERVRWRGREAWKFL